MTKVERMNQLISDLMYLNVKFHNLHWNVVGVEFEQIHILTENSYNDFFMKYDEVAERLKMLGVHPAASMAEYSKATTIKELESKDYTVPEVLGYVLESFEYLQKSFYEVRELAEAENDFSTMAMMEGYIGEFEKHIWFINSMSK